MPGSTPEAGGLKARAWTPDEDETLLTMTARGMTQSEIGRALGRSRRSVMSRLHVLRHLEQTGVGRPRDRACLCCGETFRSSGPHNRLCPVCRHGDGGLPEARLLI
jgi:hypothetical protein